MNAFGLRFLGIYMSAKLEIVLSGKLLTDLHHGLETHHAGAQQDDVVSIHQDSIVSGPSFAV